LGGVTIHVSRLDRALEAAGVPHDCIDIRRTGVVRVLFAMARHAVCHLHLSSPLAQLLLVLWGACWRTRTVLTLHGDLGRHRGARRHIVRLAVAICDVPVLLNQGSFEHALRLNRHARQLSAYIPPPAEESLPGRLQAVLQDHLARHRGGRPVVATNAFDLAYDAQGREVYGVFELIDWCAVRSLALVVSDPSGRYETEARRRHGADKFEHVVFLTGPHSFVAVLAQVDVFVRNTVTDGDSLSVHEALAQHKVVWATDVVERPRGTFVYRRLEEVDPHRPARTGWTAPPTIEKLVDIYRTKRGRGGGDGAVQD
jgi:hypothetical protein